MQQEKIVSGKNAIIFLKKDIFKPRKKYFKIVDFLKKRA
jgi:hypothetical protein